MRQAHSRAGIALVGVATLVALAACGGGSSGGGSNGGSGNGGNASDKTIVWGSTVKPEAPDPQTVVFHLASGNALWDYILSTGAGAIVDSKVFPADKKIADDKIVGSGPYELTSYKTNQVAQFKPNPNYSGGVKLN